MSSRSAPGFGTLPTGANIEYYNSATTNGNLSANTFRIDMDNDGDWDRWGVNNVSFDNSTNTWTEKMTYFDQEGSLGGRTMHYGTIEGVDSFEGQVDAPRFQEWMEANGTEVGNRDFYFFRTPTSRGMEDMREGDIVCGRYVDNDGDMHNSCCLNIGWTVLWLVIIILVWGFICAFLEGRR